MVKEYFSLSFAKFAVKLTKNFNRYAKKKCIYIFSLFQIACGIRFKSGLSSLLEVSV